jgi:hypothetical protein
MNTNDAPSTGHAADLLPELVFQRGDAAYAGYWSAPALEQP